MLRTGRASGPWLPLPCLWESFLALYMCVLAAGIQARLWGSPGSFLPPAGPPALPSYKLYLLLEFQWRLKAQGNSLGT